MSERMKLPAGWAWTTLGELCSKPQYGWTTKADKESGSVRLLRTTDISSGSIDWDTVPYCTEAPSPLAPYLLHEGDIVISRAGSVGISYLLRDVPETAVFASYLIRFRPDDEIDPKYLAYYLNTPTYWITIHEQSAGIALANVNARKLESFAVPLAPLAEQRRIVAAIEEQFTQLDAGVSALRRMQTALKRYRAAVLKAAVEGRLTADWRTTHPVAERASTLLSRILAERRTRWEAEQHAKGKDPAMARYEEPAEPDTAKLPTLPEGWVWVTLDQTALLQRGRFSVRPRNDPRYYDGQYPFLQIGDLPSDGGEIRSFHQTLNDAGRAVSREFPVGTILISIAASIGATGILTFAACFPDSLVGAICNSLTTAHYVEILLRVKRSDLQASSYASGGQPNISLPVLQSLPVPLPPLAEQEQIIADVERRLSVVGELEATVAATLKRAERLRQAILERAFSGRLVAQEAGDEPASVLLARIQAERAAQAGIGRNGRNGYQLQNGVSTATAAAIRDDVPTNEPIHAKQQELWGDESGK